jgi:YXWGXW repeat-containing protein
MNSKVLQRTILGAVLAGGTALGALAQIPIPPLPGVDVRITTRRPPPLRYERRIVSPGAGYVWVKGFWNWNGDQWEWIPGRWDRPAVAEAYWIPARYIRTSRGTIYEPGHWSNQQVVVTDEVRRNRWWRQHERMHERELERERDRDRYRDRD